MDRSTLSGWIDRYESSWRSAGTAHLRALFARDAVYVPSPYAKEIVGLEAIAEMWESEREGPHEVFSLKTEIVAVEGPTGVVRALVRYGAPLTQEYSDLWIVTLDDDATCRRFEEWPFWPGRPYAASPFGEGRLP